MTRIHLPSELPGEAPEKPGFYKDPHNEGVVWFSWFRPTWPPPRHPSGGYCSPQDKVQITFSNWTMPDPAPIAHQGIRLLGAEEPQNDGYRIALMTSFIASIEGEDPLLKTHRSEAQLKLLDELAAWGRRLRVAIADTQQHIEIRDPELHAEMARRNPDFAGGPFCVLPEEADREYAALLKRTGPKGKALAAKMRRTPRPDTEGAQALWSTDPWEARKREEAQGWAPWLPPEGGGTPPRHGRLVQALWEDIVRPQLEREDEERRKRESPVPFPHPVGRAITSSGNATIRSRNEKAASQGPEWGAFVLVDSPGMQLFLEYDGQGPGSTLRSMLTGGLLKTYLLTHAACADQAGMSLVDGAFAWDESAIYQRYVSDGKKAGGHQIDLMRDHMSQLLKMRVTSIKGIRMAQPEPLVNLYTEESTGRRVYTHAKVIMVFRREQFSQIPRAVLQLDARDVPLALALATLARDNAVKILSGRNAPEVSLEQIVSACGEDARGGVRKTGKTYWPKILDKLNRIAREGDIGELVRVDGGSGAVSSTTPVRFSLGERLAGAYAPLLRSHKTHRMAAAKRKTR